MQPYDRKAMKEIAKEKLRGSRGTMVLVTLIYALLVTGIPSILGIPGSTLNYTFNRFEYRMGPMGTIAEVAVLILTGPLMIGLLGFYRTIQEGNSITNNEIGHLFDGFRLRIGRNIALGLLISLFVALWSMLFLVPGIIAALSYSQAYYIALENPDMPAMECIRRSIIWTRQEAGASFGTA